MPGLLVLLDPDQRKRSRCGKLLQRPTVVLVWSAGGALRSGAALPTPVGSAADVAFVCAVDDIKLLSNVVVGWSFATCPKDEALPAWP